MSISKEQAAVVEELHKPAQEYYMRRYVNMRGLDETCQGDPVEMIFYAQQNKGYKYLLTVIAMFFKYASAVSTKTRSDKDVAAAMRSVLKGGRVSQKLHVDRGKEFYSKNFQTLMTEHHISMYSTLSNLEASTVGRFNRTLNDMM